MKPSLPIALEGRIELALQAKLLPQKERIMLFLNKNPGAYTLEVARNCDVGYSPNRIMELNREILPEYGLHIECMPPPKDLQNRFGQRTMVHRWGIVKLPDRWAA